MSRNDTFPISMIVNTIPRNTGRISSISTTTWPFRDFEPFMTVSPSPPPCPRPGPSRGRGREPTPMLRSASRAHLAGGARDHLLDVVEERGHEFLQHRS